jgi:cytochrome c5
MQRVGVLLLVACVLPSLAGAQQAGPPSLTGDSAIDEWVRKTFGQPVDPETLDNPVWGTKTLLSLTDAQLEGSRLFMQRCNVCHGAAMNSMDSYGPFLTKQRVDGRVDQVRQVILDGTERMPAFKYGLKPAQIDMIIDYLGTVQAYEPAY